MNILDGGFLMLRDKVTEKAFAISYLEEDNYPPAEYDLLVWSGTAIPYRNISKVVVEEWAEYLNNNPTTMLVLRGWLIR